MSTSVKSLSVVVPVHNAERNLTQQISRLLEALSDLAVKFEVLIVDDGSTDHTEDVALELSQQYPQVRVTRHSEQRGLEASAQTGAAHTTGDVVIVHSAHEPVSASQLQRAWQHRQEEELAVALLRSNTGGIHSESLRQLQGRGHHAAHERSSVPGRGHRTTGHPAPQPSRDPKKAPIPAPSFRFSTFSSPSSMHQ